MYLSLLIQLTWGCWFTCQSHLHGLDLDRTLFDRATEVHSLLSLKVTSNISHLTSLSQSYFATHILAKHSTYLAMFKKVWKICHVSNPRQCQISGNFAPYFTTRTVKITPSLPFRSMFSDSVLWCTLPGVWLEAAALPRRLQFLQKTWLLPQSSSLPVNKMATRGQTPRTRMLLQLK